MVLKYKRPKLYSTLLTAVYRTHDNIPLEKFFVLEKDYFNNISLLTIRKLISELQDGNNIKESNLEQFNLLNVGTRPCSFSRHIEELIEMFV